MVGTGVIARALVGITGRNTACAWHYAFRSFIVYTTYVYPTDTKHKVTPHRFGFTHRNHLL